MNRLDDKTLEWLVNQRHPAVRGYNGKEYDTAIDALIERKLEEGEYIPYRPPTYIISSEADEENVEVVSYGGKGGTLRIVHPTSSQTSA